MEEVKEEVKWTEVEEICRETGQPYIEYEAQITSSTGCEIKVCVYQHPNDDKPNWYLYWQEYDEAAHIPQEGAANDIDSAKLAALDAANVLRAFLEEYAEISEISDGMFGMNNSHPLWHRFLLEVGKPAYQKFLELKSESSKTAVNDDDEH